MFVSTAIKRRLGLRPPSGGARSGSLRRRPLRASRRLRLRAPTGDRRVRWGSLGVRVSVDDFAQVLPGIGREGIASAGVARAQIGEAVGRGRLAGGVESHPQSVLHDGPERTTRLLGVSLGAGQQVVLNVDGGLHAPIFAILDSMGKPYKGSRVLARATDGLSALPEADSASRCRPPRPAGSSAESLKLSRSGGVPWARTRPRDRIDPRARNACYGPVPSPRSAPRPSPPTR